MFSDDLFTRYDGKQSGHVAAEFEFVLDGKGLSLQHFFKIVANVSSVMLFLKYLQEAVPFRIKAAHIVNCSYIIDKIYVLVRPFLSKQLVDVINFHKNGLAELSEHIENDILPVEYDGKDEPISNTYATAMDNLNSNR